MERTRDRCQKHPNVTIVCAAIPGFLPEVGLNLIVLSEIGYYFDGEQLRSIGNLLVEKLLGGAVLIAAHWLGSSPHHKLHGDEVHGVLEALPGLRLRARERYDGFRIDKWTKP
jgi:hypothetical protein